MLRYAASLFFTSVALIATTTGVFARPIVQVVLTGVLVERTPTHTEHLTPLAHHVLRHDDHVRYVIRATNVGDTPALRLTPVAPIPSLMRFISASANAAAPPSYSLDNGRSWSSHLPASLGRVTRVRWRCATPLPARATRTFSYEVVVR